MTFTPVGASIHGTCACGAPLPSAQAVWCKPTCWKRREQYPSNRPSRPSRKNRPSQQSNILHVPLGVDGEGEDGKYILLCASNGKSVANRKDGLSTKDCLDFLLQLNGPQLIFGFAFSYDVNMILRDLGRDELERLAKTTRVFWGDYRIKHIDGKLLQITHRPTGKSVSIWDLYPWIQTSFVTMLEQYNLCDEKTLTRIRTMKDQRDNFRDLSAAKIKGYCVEECALLSKAVSYVLNLIHGTGFKPNGYYSPGSLAAAAMEGHGVRNYRSDPPTQAITDAIDKAFIGGRSEVSMVGPIDGPIYEYDIRSAYPYAATILPCFAHGRWVKYNGTITPYSLVKVHWQTGRQAVWGPYPVRPRTGSIRYPRSGETWVWGVEALAGRPLCSEFSVVEGYTYLPECDHKPFRYLADYYEARKVLKDASDPMEYVYKLILNSTYGKLAQRMGSSPYPPKHRFLAWAGLITAITRAMLLERIVEAGENILLCATDGILSRQALTVEIGENLGQWESNNYADIFIAGPGFYFATRDDSGKPKIRNRGISRADVSPERLSQEWVRAGRLGSVRISTRRFIGYRLALQRLQGLTYWRHFTDVNMIKTLTVEPRRQWLTDDPFDGRSIAPSFKAHKELERADESINRQLAFTLWREIGPNKDQGDIDKIGELVSAINPWSFRPAEQPDYLIDEFPQA